ncbi:hypothetical protein CHS0354_020086 [Potamilus streckersoni]|uniref:Translation initiation factor eIF2B subunit delta n=1 Tax=Potamilus streckersoni TaxID=2493646 RepID=A0AAE0SDB0_9BIVA|nr:hypothetical protein CHS0354_020086 [Potamilus streckersoni]
MSYVGDTTAVGTDNPKEEGTAANKNKKEKKQKAKNPEEQAEQKGKTPQGAGGVKPVKDGEVLAHADSAVIQKSKAELRKERREKQEAQRAAKEAGKVVKKEVPQRVPDHMKADVAETQKRVAKKLEKQQIPMRTTAQRKVRLFDHLPQYEREASLTKSISFCNSGIHPAIIKLGIQYAEGVINGSNSRCIALLAALKQVIGDYSTPPNQELPRDLAAKLKPCISFLNQCRPLSVSMGTAIKYLKWQITNIPGDMNDVKAKELLYGHIQNFLEDRILVAAAAISNEAVSKIADGDVILVYACSSLIRRVLCDAHKKGKKFRVIVVDGRPKMEGKEMLRRLVQEGIKSSYVLINAASYVIKEATKVFLGANGLLANGFVMSRVGSSLIALMARSSNVPVLVCCETYKFCERVQTDSFVFNELGDPDDLVDIGNRQPILADWRDHNFLTLLNLVYDFTPPEFISMVITELGMIPCTSVPVVLRMKQQDMNET